MEAVSETRTRLRSYRKPNQEPTRESLCSPKTALRETIGRTVQHRRDIHRSDAVGKPGQETIGQGGNARGNRRPTPSLPFAHSPIKLYSRPAPPWVQPARRTQRSTTSTSTRRHATR